MLVYQRVLRNQHDISLLSPHASFLSHLPVMLFWSPRTYECPSRLPPLHRSGWPAAWSANLLGVPGRPSAATPSDGGPPPVALAGLTSRPVLAGPLPPALSANWLTHQLASTHKRQSRKKTKWKKSLDLFPNIFGYIQIISNNIHLYLILSSI